MNQPTSISLAESGDLLLPLDGLDSERLDSATTNHTHKQSSKSIGQKFQSTETSKHSMARHTEESLFLLGDFPASHSVTPGSGEARTMTAISGQKCSESYKRQSQLGSLVRMLLASSAWHSTKCVLIWKRADMKSSRSLFQLAVSMPRTEETEFGLLRGGGAEIWPTPSVCGNYNRKGASKNSGNGLATAVLLWPTPTRREYFPPRFPETMKKTKRNPMTNSLGDAVQHMEGKDYKQTGQLNPDWVEWLMGYPIGWTDLKDWAMPSSRKSHTKSSKR